MKVLGFDLETSIGSTVHGADPRDPNNDFYTVIYGNSPDNVHVDHRVAGFNRQLSLCRHLSLEDTDLIVGHNLGFDLHYIYKDPMFIEFLKRGGRIWDTQVAEYILTGQQHRYSSLAELQEKHLGEKKKIDKISRLFRRGIGADRIVAKAMKAPRIWTIYNTYCKLDVATTLLVLKSQYIKAKKEGMLAAIELYNDYLLALVNMANTGIQFDKDKAQKLQRDYNLKYVEYLQKAQQILTSKWDNPRLPEFKVNSVDHKSAVMFGGVVKNTIRTKVGKYKNGNDKYKNVEHEIYIPGFELSTKHSRPAKKEGYYSTSEDVIKKLKLSTTNQDFLNYVECTEKAAEYKKAANTDLSGFLKYCIGNTIYPNFNNTQVVTGRLSSSRPNLQNITKHSKIGKQIHSLLTAPDDFKCVSIDFSQLEIWVSAFLSNDKQLIEDLMSGIDMHCMRVSHMEGCSYEEALNKCKSEQIPEWVAKRSAAKTFSYQRAYGAGIVKLEEFTGLNKETLQKLITAEESRYPRASTLFERVGKDVKNSLAISRSLDLPSKIRGKNVLNNVELLPIFDKSSTAVYTKEVRQIGFWVSPTGKKYHFPDTGRVFRGHLKRSISPTILKNYPMQGTAADIQGATSAALMPLLYKHPDKIMMVNEIHDSKWFYMHEEYITRLIPHVCNIMEDVGAIFKERFGIDVPFRFPVDVSVGDSFNESEMNTYDFKTIEDKQYAK